MQKDKTPRRISITEIITKDDNWNKYSLFHDSFLEELSYERQKICSTDIWPLHDN